VATVAIGARDGVRSLSARLCKHGAASVANGHVTAVDRAAPEYGAPTSLGQATEHLKATPLGQRIDFHFHYDVLDLSHEFAPDAFDYVVLAHCSWYFDSLDQLRRTLRRVHPWAPVMCYSEWDMKPRTLDQVAHLLAVLIQGQIGSFNIASTRNVRTPFSRATLERLLPETGWIASSEAAIDTYLLKDADWEIEDCLRSCASEAEALNLPLKQQEFLGSQLDILRSMASKSGNRPLPSYWIVAKRSPETRPASLYT
jgi:hypothetical protein